jgi:tetratricopeptide (TPR) repeat protein
MEETNGQSTLQQFDGVKELEMEKDFLDEVDDDDSDDDMDIDGVVSEEADEQTSENEEEYDVELLRGRATACKDRGNELLKSGDTHSARVAYEDGLVSARRAEDTGLLVALRGNLCMLSIKELRWADAIRLADEVISIEPSNVKAHYRRGLALLRSGDAEAAKRELIGAIELDPMNAAARKDLAEATAVVKKLRADEKAAYSGFFNKSGMYDDREEERKRKLRREEEDREKLEDDWTRSKLDRRSKGLSEQTFEEFKKDREDAAAKAAELAKQREVSLPHVPKKKVEVVDSALDLEYDEEEERILREAKAKGYCYFKKEASEVLNFSVRSRFVLFDSYERFFGFVRRTLRRLLET